MSTAKIEFDTTQDDDGFAATIVIDGEEVGEITPPNPDITDDAYVIVGWADDAGNGGWSRELRPGQGFDDAKRWVVEHPGEFAPPQPKGA